MSPKELAEHLNTTISKYRAENGGETPFVEICGWKYSTADIEALVKNAMQMEKELDKYQPLWTKDTPALIKWRGEKDGL